MENKLKDNLILLRKVRKMSQDKFAKYLETKRSTYANWESGQAEPPVSAILHICNKLNLTPTDLMTDIRTTGEVFENSNEEYQGEVSGEVSGEVLLKKERPELSEFVVDAKTAKHHIFANLIKSLAEWPDARLRGWALMQLGKMTLKGLNVNLEKMDLLNTYILTKTTLELIEAYNKIDSIEAINEEFLSKLM